MRTLIQTQIILQQSDKKGAYQYKIEFCKRNPHQLTIKAQSHNGKTKRVVGSVDREGKIFMKLECRWSQYIFNKVDVLSYQNKIDTVLDLVFGVKRDKFPEPTKTGQIEFKNN